MYKEKILDLETNEITVKDLSIEQIKEIEAAQTEYTQKTLTEAQAAAEAAAAKAALLAKLGITEDEAKLLLS